MNIGKSINIACSKYGKLKKDLARHVGVSTQTMSNWSKGHCEPSHFHIDMMAEYFGIKTSAFVALSEE